MDEGGARHEGSSGSSDPVGRSGSVRKISWILAAAVLLFAGAYFLGGLRNAEPDGGDEVRVVNGDGSGAGDASEPVALDTLITPADLPGFETEALTNGQRLWLYHRAHREQCACECGMTVAQCRVDDPTCPESPGRAVELVREAQEAVPGGG